MSDPTEAISAAKGPSVQGQAAIAATFKPMGGPSGDAPAVNNTFPRHDTVEISDVARLVAKNGGGGQAPVTPKGNVNPGAQGGGQGAPAQKPGRAPDGDATNVPDGDADDVHFSYDSKTNILQTQIVNAKTGKPVVEIPSDEQIKMKENLRKFLERGQAPAQDPGNTKR